MKKRTDLRLRTLIDQLYESVGDVDAWSGLAYRIADTFDSNSVVLKMQNDTGCVHLVETTDNLVIPDKNREWAEYWHKNDLWVERCMARGISKIHTSQNLMSKAEFEASGFYQEWLRSLDIYHLVGTVFPIYSKVTGAFGIHRPKDATCFEPEECRRVVTLLPHLRRAFSMHMRLTDTGYAIKSATDVLKVLDKAVVIVDIRYRLLYANPVAEQLMRGDFPVTVINGRVQLREQRLTETFHSLIRRSLNIDTSTPFDAVMYLPRLNRLPVILSASPLASRWTSELNREPAVIIWLNDPEKLTASLTVLRQLYGLTPTEASVSEILATGKSLEEIAAQLTISVDTVRTHLKKVFAKTGTARQAQLVALIKSSVPTIPPDKSHSR